MPKPTKFRLLNLRPFLENIMICCRSWHPLLQPLEYYTCTQASLQVQTLALENNLFYWQNSHLRLLCWHITCNKFNLKLFKLLLLQYTIISWLLLYTCLILRKHGSNLKIQLNLS